MTSGQQMMGVKNEHGFSLENESWVVPIQS